MKKIIKKIIYEYRFETGIFGLLFNPVYFANKEEESAIKNNSDYIKNKILDVGCGSKPYENSFQSSTDYIGLDTDNSGHNHNNENIDVFYDGRIFPFEDKTFDSVVSFQVLEHVENEKLFLSEIKRVLKPNGTLMLTMPFMWEEHEVPYDFRRYTSYGLKKLFEDMGFEIEKYKKVGANNSFFFQRVNTYLRKFRRKKYIYIAIPLILLSNLFGLISNLFPTINNNIYNGHLIVLKKSN